MRTSIWVGLVVCFLSTQIFDMAPRLHGQILGRRQAMANVRPAGRVVAPVESENFIVYANDAQLAAKVSRQAERFRKDLSIQWLGRTLDKWHDKCPIEVQVKPLAGGETSFGFVRDRFGKGQPMDWQMKIFGPPDRLLDAVLPHEITHTIFATHFGQPLPRWADEGACTTVEHESERRKNHQMLMQFLSAKPTKGIPFNQMFQMRRYPADPLPLYAQGHSLAKYLIQEKGKIHFVNFIARGLELEKSQSVLKAWNSSVEEFYAYRSLSDLQLKWIAWVEKGSPALDANSTKGAVRLAGFEDGDSGSNGKIALATFAENPKVSQQGNTAFPRTGNSWYHRQMRQANRNTVDANVTRRISPSPSVESSQKTIQDSRLPARFAP
ncbi:MAG: hypothetical protein AAF623_04555, partial [Planctomycetota bacterium]